MQECPYNVGLDSAILMNPQVWVASGHVVNFNDPLIDCKSCKMRHRADKLIGGVGEARMARRSRPTAMSNDELFEFITEPRRHLPGLRQMRFHTTYASST